MEKWFVAAKRADFQAIAEKYHIDQVIARIIRNRDVVGDEAIENYLNGSLADLHDPHLMHGTIPAAKLLIQKIEEKKKIRIIGDYDIDGVNATYILYQGLKKLGANVDYEIPDRMKDGYGLNINLIDLAAGEKIDTILTCDNGISAIEQITHAKDLGMTVIVTDHHEPLYEPDTREWLLPPADVLIDPKLPDCRYPYKKLCGATVAWKMLQVLYAMCGCDPKDTFEFLSFVAVATVGDVMDLDGENRILVKYGLQALTQTNNPGFRALIRATGLEGKKLSAYHIGFILGPCINASGRLDTAKRSLKLLLSRDPKEAEQFAEELKRLNDERKDLTQEGVDQAILEIENTSLKEDRVLVVYLPDCHESVAGIIAGRLREYYHKPSFVLTRAAEGIKGSGRSIEAYSMFDELVKCQDLFTKFGGHPMAAGISMALENLEPFRNRINENCMLTEEDLTEKIMIDVPMPIHYITEHLVSELELLEPFGKGNTKPLFAEKDLNFNKASLIGRNRNVLKFQVSNGSGARLEALYFGDVEKMMDYIKKKYGTSQTERLFQGRENNVSLSVTYYPGVNEYMGRKTLQIVIQNYL